MDRPERVGFAPDEALVLLEHRNLKSQYNRYLEIFRKFVEDMDNVDVQGIVNSTVFARLQKLVRESKDVPDFVRKLAVSYSANVDEKINEFTENKRNLENVAMFSSETEAKILNKQLNY